MDAHIVSKRGGLMARRSNDIPEMVVHVLTVASSVEIAAGGTCTEQQVRAKLADSEIHTDWEGSPAGFRPRHVGCALS
jgi:hypothetical protein